MGSGGECAGGAGPHRPPCRDRVWGRSGSPSFLAPRPSGPRRHCRGRARPLADDGHRRPRASRSREVAWATSHARGHGGGHRSHHGHRAHHTGRARRGRGTPPGGRPTAPRRRAHAPVEAGPHADSRPARPASATPRAATSPRCGRRGGAGRPGRRSARARPSPHARAGLPSRGHRADHRRARGPRAAPPGHGVAARRARAEPHGPPSARRSAGHRSANHHSAADHRAPLRHQRRARRAGPGTGRAHPARPRRSEARLRAPAPPAARPSLADPRPRQVAPRDRGARRGRASRGDRGAAHWLGSRCRGRDPVTRSARGRQGRASHGPAPPSPTAVGEQPRPPAEMPCHQGPSPRAPAGQGGPPPPAQPSPGQHPRPHRSCQPLRAHWPWRTHSRSGGRAEGEVVRRRPWPPRAPRLRPGRSCVCACVGAWVSPRRRAASPRWPRLRQGTRRGSSLLPRRHAAVVAWRRPRLPRWRSPAFECAVGARPSRRGHSCRRCCRLSPVPRWLPFGGAEPGDRALPSCSPPGQAGEPPGLPW